MYKFSFYLGSCFRLWNYEVCVLTQAQSMPPSLHTTHSPPHSIAGGAESFTCKRHGSSFHCRNVRPILCHDPKASKLIRTEEKPVDAAHFCCCIFRKLSEMADWMRHRQGANRERLVFLGFIPRVSCCVKKKKKKKGKVNTISQAWSSCGR